MTAHDPHNGQFTSSGSSASHKDDHVFSKMKLAISHAQLTKAFSVQGLVAQHIRTDPLDKGGAKTTFALHDSSGKKVGTISRRFEEHEGRTIVHHDHFELDATHQGKGVAKALLKNSVKLYKTHNISEIQLDAGLDQGRYVWAHLGFKATPHEVKLYKDALLSRHSDLLKKEIGDNSSAYIPLSSRQMTRIAKIKSMQQIAEYKIKDPSGKEIYLGKLLLLDSGNSSRRLPEWHGTIQIKDGDASYEHFKKKIGLD